MNLNIKKKDISINPDGSVNINNPVLKAQVEKISTEPGDSIMVENQCTNNCYGGCQPTTDPGDIVA